MTICNAITQEISMPRLLALLRLRGQSCVVHVSKCIVKARSCSSSASIEKISTPPRLVRVLLVGTSVGLATPMVSVVGLARLWFQYLPKTELGQAGKVALGLVMGGGGMTLIYKYMIPFLRDNSHLVLPFALANSVAASFWYYLGEMTVGLETMLSMKAVDLSKFGTKPMVKLLSRIPFIAGGGLGALTALTSPLLWPLFMNLCWDEDTKETILRGESTWVMDLYNWVLLPVGLPVGIAAGAVLQFALQPVVAGKPGIPWTSRSLPALAGVAGCSALYFYWFRREPNDLVWEPRMNIETGVLMSYNPRTKKALEDGGERASWTSFQLSVADKLHFLRKPIDFSHLLYSASTAGSRDRQRVQVRQISGGINPWNRESGNCPPRVLQDAGETGVHLVGCRSAMNQLRDVLLRWKYLELLKEKDPHFYANDPEFLSQQESVLQLARQSFGLSVEKKGLQRLFVALERAILFKRQLSETGLTHDKKAQLSRELSRLTNDLTLGRVGSVNEAAADNASSWSDLLTSLFLTGKANNGNEGNVMTWGQYATTMILFNLSAYEDELRHRLQYEVTGNVEDKRDPASMSTTQLVLYSSVVASVVGAVAFAMTSR